LVNEGTAQEQVQIWSGVNDEDAITLNSALLNSPQDTNLIQQSGGSLLDTFAKDHQAWTNADLERPEALAPEPLTPELPAFGAEEGQITPPTNQQRQRLEGILGFYQEQSGQEMPTGRFNRITREQASAEALRQQSAPYLNPLLGDAVDQDMRDRVASDPVFEGSLNRAESREGIRAGRRSLRQRKRDARRQ